MLRLLVCFNDPRRITVHIGGIDIDEELCYWRTPFPAGSVELHSVPALCSWDARLPWLLLRLVHTVQPDIVHTHGYKADCIGALLKPAVAAPLVATVHGWTDASLPVRLYKRLDLLALRQYDRVVGVSDHICDAVVSAGVPRARVTRVYTGVEIPEDHGARWDEGSASWRHRLEISKNDFIVGSVGRLSPEKGHRFLLQAFAMLRDKDVDAHLIIAGDGTQRRLLEREASRLHIAADTSFVGYQRKPRELMRLFDVLVMPSLREGLPWVILEALSVGVPVVASRVGGIPEIIKDGQHGLLAERRDPEDLSAKIMTLVQDPGLRSTLGRQGLDRVATAFAVQRMVSETGKVYEDLISP